VSDRPPPLLDGLADRILSTGKIAAAGARLASRRAFGFEGERDAKLGAALATELDRMKGMAMKVGQIFSYFDGILPDQAQEALRGLQQGATRLPYGRVARVIEEELGRPIEAVFEDFERDPAASASIGQVHRARYKGRAVAVKIQYPGLADSIEADFARLRPFTRLISVGTAVDGPRIADDLVARLVEECDYRTEAASQEAFRAAFAADPEIAIPAVVPEATSRRVLTMAWAEGRDLYRFATEAPQGHRDAATRTLVRFVYRSLFELETVNADPHPGNYLFPRGCPTAAPIVFLDFGCTHAFTPEFMASERAIARCVIDGHRDRFDEVFLATGMVASPRGFDYDVQWRMHRLQYRPFWDREFVYTTDFMREAMEMSGPSNPNLRRLAISNEWVWLQRLVWGLHAVLVRFGARAPLGDVLREQLDRPRAPLVRGDGSSQVTPQSATP